MFLVRQGTPISDIDPNELPSPRQDGKKKKIKVLPYYSEKIEDKQKKKRIIQRQPYLDKNLIDIIDLISKNRSKVIQNVINHLNRKQQPSKLTEGMGTEETKGRNWPTLRYWRNQRWTKTPIWSRFRLTIFPHLELKTISLISRL